MLAASYAGRRTADRRRPNTVRTSAGSPGPAGVMSAVDDRTAHQSGIGYSRPGAPESMSVSQCPARLTLART